AIPAKMRAHGKAEIGYAIRDGQTRLKTLYQRDPLRVLFPLPAPGDLTSATLVTTSGGVTGGDSLSVSVSAGAHTRAMVLGQAAEKIYRSAGEDTNISVSLDVAEGAWLEWLPQETILFNGARLRRDTTVHVTADARLLAAEFLVFGRKAHGESLQSGLIRDAWSVYRDDALVWADALHLEGDLAAQIGHGAGFHGAGACATAIWTGEDRTTEIREMLRESPVRCGVTRVNGLNVMRWLDADAAAVRRAFGQFWAAFRASAGGLPGRLPRLWEI
ncbi:MAG: urease accessory protein UreD, partial [Magnetospiraceae bacterium]